jgi:hypothetical protein
MDSCISLLLTVLARSFDRRSNRKDKQLPRCMLSLSLICAHYTRHSRCSSESSAMTDSAAGTPSSDWASKYQRLATIHDDLNKKYTKLLQESNTLKSADAAAVGCAL